jgi:hypothetical protein
MLITIRTYTGIFTYYMISNYGHNITLRKIMLMIVI